MTDFFRARPGLGRGRRNALELSGPEHLLSNQNNTTVCRSLPVNFVLG